MTIGQNKHRTLFLSDLHLGSYNCKAKRLYEFLWRNDADQIYLIGDIIERNISHKWPPYHDDVLRILLEKASAGTEIIFVPGNHDRMFLHHIGVYGNLKIANHANHEGADGKILLIVHGDETDLFTMDALLWLIVKLEAITGWNLWEILRKSFGRLIKRHIESFENKMMTYAHDMGYLGIVCGHIHAPKIVDRGALYLNAGDWTHHCTAIAEDQNGKFKILYG